MNGFAVESLSYGKVAQRTCGESVMVRFRVGGGAFRFHWLKGAPVALMFGLFGIKKKEKELRSALSLHKFEMEFPRVLEDFKLAPATRASKSDRYAEIEAVARFILEHVLADAVAKGKVRDQDDLAATATFSAWRCDYLGTNGGLEKAEIRELQGMVPGFVFPKTAAKLMQSSGDFRAILSKGLIKYEAIASKGKYQAVMDRMDDALTQFVCQRRTEYLSVFGEVIASLKN